MAPGIPLTSSSDPARLGSLAVNTCPTRSCGQSRFPWRYDEQQTW